MTNGDIVQTDLSSLVSYYEKECLERLLEIEEKGVPFRARIDGGSQTESDVLYLNRVYLPPESKKLYNARRMAFNQILLRKLREVNTHNSELLECIEDTVIDPYLDAAFGWLTSSGGLTSLGGVDSVSDDEFVASVDPINFVKYRFFGHYARPIVFLGLLLRHPELRYKLRADSTFSIDEDFRKVQLKHSSIRDLDKRIAHHLPDLFSEELLERIKKIEQYIKAGGQGSSGVNRFNGKYKIPTSTLF